MSEPIGSKQYRSVVVQEPAAKSFRRRLIIGLMALALVAVGYWLGDRGIVANLHQGEQVKSLKQQLDQSRAETTELRQQLVNLKLGADIDRQSVNEVRAMVREHKQTINRLNKDITFYKGLMSPTEREKGLGIRSWELYPGSAPNRFQFKLILQQLALKHRLLKGQVKVNIIGRQAGAEKIIPLAILSEQVDSGPIALRFKYYQYIEGELVLPAGFEPSGVDIVARATSPKKVKVEKFYVWAVQQS